MQIYANGSKNIIHLIIKFWNQVIQFIKARPNSYIIVSTIFLMRLFQSQFA